MPNLRPDHRLTALALAAVAAGLLLAVTALPGHARGCIEVEGETFQNFHDIGGMMITAVACGNASGGWVADGLDVAGEWIELVVNLTVTRCFADSIGFQAQLDQTTQVRMTVLDFSADEVILTCDYEFTGEGVGCVYPIVWAGSGEPCCLDAGAYRLRVELVAGTRTRVDVVSFDYDDVPLGERSWSGVKRLFR